MNEQLPCQWVASLNHRALAGSGFQVHLYSESVFSALYFPSLFKIFCSAHQLPQTSLEGRRGVCVCVGVCARTTSLKASCSSEYAAYWLIQSAKVIHLGESFNNQQHPCLHLKAKSQCWKVIRSTMLAALFNCITFSISNCLLKVWYIRSFSLE